MTRNTTSELLDESKNILFDTEQLIADAAKATGEEAKALQTKIIASLRAAKQRLGEVEAAAIAKGKAAAKATDTYVHENPWKSVGIGAAVGVVIGMLIARR